MTLLLPLELETWRPIAHTRLVYEVSNLGAVRRVLRSGETKILTPNRKKSGHLWVSLGRNDRRYVHHLVLLAFVGAPPDGCECCHYDDNPANNRLSNLRWDSRGANHADFKRNYGYSQKEGHHAHRRAA